MAAVDRRLARLKIEPPTAVAIVAGLILLVADTQSLTLIPLTTPLATEYKLSAPQVPLVLSILTIVAAGTVPVMTRVAERISLRWFLIAGLALSTIGNLLCAVAPGFGLLIIGRILLGLSASSPISYALLREKSADASGTNRGVGIVAAATGLTVAASFLMGGFIIELHGSVSIVFWVMTILAGLSLLVAVAVVPDFRVPSRDRVDYLGALLLIVGLTALAIMFSYGSTWGWASARTLSVLIGGVVVLALWIWVELVVKNPMIELRRTFRRTTVPAFISVGLYAAVAIMTNLAVVSYAESPSALGYGMSYTVLGGAVLLLPTCVFLFITGLFTSAIVGRIGVKPTMVTGAALLILTGAFLAVWHTQLWQYLVGLSVWGIAFSLGYSGANLAYLHAAKDNEASMFSAASSVMAGAVGGFGAPVFTAILLATTATIPLKTGGSTQVPTAQSYTNEWWAIAVIGVLALFLGLILKRVSYQGGITERISIVPDEAAGTPSRRVLE